MAAFKIWHKKKTLSQPKKKGKINKHIFHNKPSCQWAEKKERYTIREAIALTEGQYNAERFAEFFAG